MREPEKNREEPLVRVELPGPCPHCGYCYGVMIADIDPRRVDKAMKLKCGRCRKIVARDHTPIEEEQ